MLMCGGNSYFDNCEKDTEQCMRNPRLLAEHEEKYNLLELKELADELCKEASERYAEFADEPINWPDLKCNTSEYIENHAGEKYYRVIIEEASPEAYKFAQFLYDGFRERGFFDVYVNTEW